uniref:E2F/DP family winged-helix DNA-binding domain-containing protein n=1 Tax=Octactis speculum TaxID=3111310 RepID=A0A7S2C998_9STRA|mmetsp:Transcript_32998/g.44704  ORF Transcript_32998/g.44704 Transcript_32998/m.44704 type:complete len:353 (+) Transcript_32998:146-1204(+)|eukprot:CAMPEP_0185746230 /NCGR_PEP_ID=MMETSP1174-20130828/4721_1 /TAXON_ID=35687 /ORGANISM="Dictyocha speculum, Strain CCMP1381" /LENGTH=352 /DNA_ID=CAMNT_0028420743 /DNA_START=140 /DNA_END=1198 /DNA_ORIENTATION=-
MEDTDLTPRRRIGAGAKRPRVKVEDEDESVAVSPPNVSRNQSGTMKTKKTPYKSPGTGCRFDNSLGLLTKKFLNLLQSSPDGTLDLNKAASNLEVQKRRIYDITNVLEGINLIEKQSKNIIVWKGSGLQVSNELQQKLDSLREANKNLEMEESQLNRCLRQMEDNLHAITQRNPKRMYMRHADILVECGEKNTVLAIRGLAGTTLEVPDPDEGMKDGERRYEMYLKSDRGAIDVYLISQLPETSRIEHFEESEPAGRGVPTPIGPVIEPPSESDAAMMASASAQCATSPLPNGSSRSGGAACYLSSPSSLVHHSPAAKLDPGFDFGLDDDQGVTDLFSEDLFVNFPDPIITT